MTLPTILVVWLSALVLGSVVVLAGLGRLLGASRGSAREFLLQVRRLLGANHRERAIRLASAEPGSSVQRLTLFALQLRVPLLDPVSRLAGYYRTSPEERPFEDRVREALETERSAILGPVERLWWGALVSGLAGGATALPVLWSMPEVRVQVLGATSLLALLALVVTWRCRKLSQELALVVDTMAPHVLPETQEGAMIN